MNLLHLYKNIPTNTVFGQEIFTVIEYFVDREVKKKSILKKVTIDLEMYLKIFNQKMSLTTEIRTCFLGYPMKNKCPGGGFEFITPIFPWFQDSDDEDFGEQPYARKLAKKKAPPQPVYFSIFKPITDDPKFVDRSAQMSHLFAEIDVIDDTSFGQRGFNRNIERLCNQLIQFYKTKYPEQYTNTMIDMEAREEEERQAKRQAEKDKANEIKMA